MNIPTSAAKPMKLMIIITPIPSQPPIIKGLAKAADALANEMA
ncbi:hypothetical protein ACP2W0_09695 [Pseudobacillus badius]|nr:hypothetical protein [Bacillus badius]